MPNEDNYRSVDEGGARRYPKTLRLTVETPAEAARRTERAAVETGTADEAVRSFHSADPIRRLMTGRRLEVMREIMTDPPGSIRELADRLGRNYSDVHSDVELLADHHVVYFERDGRSKRPVIPYRTVEFDVTVRADSEPA